MVQNKDANSETRSKHKGNAMSVMVASLVTWLVNFIATGIYSSDILTFILAVAETVLGVMAWREWAQYKGRRDRWMLLGLLTPISFIGMPLLKDKGHGITGSIPPSL